MDPAPGAAPAAPHRFALAPALLLAVLLTATATGSGPGVPTPVARSTAAATATTPPDDDHDRDHDHDHDHDRERERARDAARPGDGEPVVRPAQARPRPAHVDERPSPPDPRTGNMCGAAAPAITGPRVPVPTRPLLSDCCPAQDSGRSPPAAPGT